MEKLQKLQRNFLFVCFSPLPAIFLVFHDFHLKNISLNCKAGPVYCQTNIVSQTVSGPSQLQQHYNPIRSVGGSSLI